MLTKPRATVSKLLTDSDNRERTILQGALTYSTISIALGLCLAQFLNIGKQVPAVTPLNVLGVLVVWVIYALILHPLLRWFGGKGRLADTIAVFLLIASTLNLLFVPAAKVLTTFVTKTKVVLSYDYAISMGPLWQHNKVESYFKDKEPEKEGTVKLPMDKVPPKQNDRISEKESPYPLPKRYETPAIDWDLGLWIIGFSLIYYFSHVYYLSEALAVPHFMPIWKLRLLGTAGVFVSIIVFTLLAAAVLYGLFSY